MANIEMDDYDSMRLLFDSIKAELKTRVTEISYDTWIEPLVYDSSDNNTIRILVPDDIAPARYHIVATYGNTFSVEFSNRIGRNVNVDFFTNISIDEWREKYESDMFS